jgi:hypothetical protein
LTSERRIVNMRLHGAAGHPDGAPGTTGRVAIVRLVMTLTVRDEEDIVEENLAYHLNAGVDFIVATDNVSHDGTTEILERYERAGYLLLLRDPDTSHRQAASSTRMARLAATELRADWILHNDGDQFWWPEVDASLREIFASIPPEYGIVVAPKHDFVARELEGRPWHERLTVRPATPSRRPGEKRRAGTSTAIAHRPDARASVTQGNHALLDTELVPLPPWFPIFILHFPDRSFDQFKRRVRYGVHAYARNDEVPVRCGRHKRALYEPLVTGHLDDHWRRSVVVDETAIAEALASGTLVEDVRLRDRLAALRAGPDADTRYTLPPPDSAGADVPVRVDLVRALDREAAAAREFALQRQLSSTQKALRRKERELQRVRARNRLLAAPLSRLVAVVHAAGRRSRGATTATRTAELSKAGHARPGA